MSKLEDYKNFGRQILGTIYEPGEHERIYEHLGMRDAAIHRIPKDKFGIEYLSARLALNCRLWVDACHENKVVDPEIEKSFLKLVMDSFQSPKFMEIATTFSDYLYAPGMEDPHSPASIHAVSHFYKRVGLTAADTASQPKSMVYLMEILEAYKDRFMNDFFEFAASH